MPIPNGGLITETNRQYYAGSQQFTVPATAVNQTFTSTFDTQLVVGTGNYSDQATNGYNLNNFKVYLSSNAQVWTELTPKSTDVVAAVSGTNAQAQPILNIVSSTASEGGNVIGVFNASTNVFLGNIVSFTTNAGVDALTLSQNLPTGGVSNINVLLRRLTPWQMSTPNIITIIGSLALNTYVKIELNEDAKENNFGGYEYTRLNDVIDNFLIAYVGAGKLIPSVKRTDVIFHARRGLQEFSYDTLKSIKSSELTVPSTLSLTIPQDYVNYVKLSWVDELGVLHPIYPTNNLNQSPPPPPPPLIIHFLKITLVILYRIVTMLTQK